MSEIVALRRLKAADWPVVHSWSRVVAKPADTLRLFGKCGKRPLGMTYEGKLRHTMLIRDGWRDSELFSILEDEWRAR